MAKQQGGGRSAAARRTVVKSRERARSNAYQRNTIEASKNKPLTQAGSQGSGGGKKPPTTKTGTAAKEPARSTGGRSGKGKALAKAGRTAARGERLVGSGTVPYKKPLPGPSSVKSASKARALARGVKGVGRKLPYVGTVLIAADLATKVTKDVTSRRAAEKEAAKPKPITGRVVKGAPPGTMAAAKKAAKSAPPKAATTTQKQPAPSSKKGGGRKSPGYTYTGPKVGSAEYKAMRQKKYEANKAKARRNIAASRKGPASSKIKTVQRQQGTQKPNYESYQRGMRAPNSRQVKWTDNETTNQNLKASALRPQGDSGDKPKRSKLYGVRKVLSAMGYAGEVR